MSPSLRTAASAVLIAVSCLLAPFGTLAAWAAYDLTDTGRYVTTMGPLASDPAVRDAVVDTLGDGVAREAGVEDGPNRLFIRDAVRSFTETRAYRTAWDAGNEAAHTAVMRALNDDSADRDTHPVTMDLAAVTTPSSGNSPQTTCRSPTASRWSTPVSRSSRPTNWSHSGRATTCST